MDNYNWEGRGEGGPVLREGDIFGKNAFSNISFYWPQDQESSLCDMNFPQRWFCETPVPTAHQAFFKGTHEEI